MSALRPVILQVPHTGDGDRDRRLEFIEGNPQEGFDGDGEDDPAEHDKAQNQKGLGLIETGGRHGQGRTLDPGAPESIRYLSGGRAPAPAVN